MEFQAHNSATARELLGGLPITFKEESHASQNSLLCTGPG
jgi:hypothetical protein